MAHSVSISSCPVSRAAGYSLNPSSMSPDRFLPMHVSSVNAGSLYPHPVFHDPAAHQLIIALRNSAALPAEKLKQGKTVHRVIPGVA